MVKRIVPKTRAQAIVEMCKECIVDDSAYCGQGWRRQVEACTCSSCPLYAFRPLRCAGEAARRAAKRK